MSNEEIERFLQLIKQGYQPAVFLLFGSRARGDALAQSDYDFLIVSARFEGSPFKDQSKRVMLSLRVRPVLDGRGNLVLRPLSIHPPAEIASSLRSSQ